MAQLAVAAMAMNYVGTIMEGRDAYKARQREANQMESMANEERAVAQRRAIQARKRAEKAKSRAKAVAAASGAGATDPTVENIMGDLEDQGTMAALSELYEGETRGRNLEFGARQRKKLGKSQLRSSRYNAVGSLLEGGSSLYDRYG